MGWLAEQVCVYLFIIPGSGKEAQGELKVSFKFLHQLHIFTASGDDCLVMGLQTRCSIFMSFL